MCDGRVCPEGWAETPDQQRRRSDHYMVGEPRAYDRTDHLCATFNHERLNPQLTPQ